MRSIIDFGLIFISDDAIRSQTLKPEVWIYMKSSVWNSGITILHFVSVILVPVSGWKYICFIPVFVDIS